jgi:16S rRNA (guanine527-N7)-methyltransferase
MWFYGMSLSMEAENKIFLVQGAKAFGIYLDEKAIGAFDLYLKELLKWNQKINLTAIRSEKGMVIKHFLDSLSVNPYLSKHSSILDIGSGAGFPGIPLKIVQSTLEVALIDSVLKKVDFQRHILRMIGLKEVEAIHGRIQDKEILQRLAGRFDIVLSRAFSDLHTFLTLSFPFLKEKGTLIAMKGEVHDKEMKLLLETKVTRYRLKNAVPLILPFSSFKRTILLFEKG